jgi:hypothetical protein
MFVVHKSQRSIDHLLHPSDNCANKKKRTDDQCLEITPHECVILRHLRLASCKPDKEQERYNSRSETGMICDSSCDSKDRKDLSRHRHRAVNARFPAQECTSGRSNWYASNTHHVFTMIRKLRRALFDSEHACVEISWLRNSSPYIVCVSYL